MLALHLAFLAQRPRPSALQDALGPPHSDAPPASTNGCSMPPHAAAQQIFLRVPLVLHHPPLQRSRKPSTRSPIISQQPSTTPDNAPQPPPIRHKPPRWRGAERHGSSSARAVLRVVSPEQHPLSAYVKALHYKMSASPEFPIFPVGWSGQQIHQRSHFS